jgi:hypothetical protein
MKSKPIQSMELEYTTWLLFRFDDEYDFRF